ncbi:MAG TPA: hypothetical protein VJ874_01535 [Candidatus Thermoplasmatota archaeon]|nr:hypothetical protein [Candidatus Thermoplasmatota archaeon]
MGARSGRGIAVALCAAAGVASAALWWILSEWLFDGGAPSLLPAHVTALALALVSAWAIARSGRMAFAAAAVLVVGAALVSLAVAWWYSNAVWWPMQCDDMAGDC